MTSSSAETSILQIRSIAKRFGEVQAVCDFNLDVARGEFVTLLGPSGCGKTTTLRMIMGFVRSDNGSIVLNGRTLDAPGRRIFVPPESRTTAMVFQSYAVWPHMKVFDNVAYPSRMQHRPRVEVRERTMRALELVGLAALSERHPQELSGGQQQRVALARALSMRANLLLLDEPLSNLDAKLRESMRFEIRELQRETQSTTVYVTHDQTEAMAMSDRIVVMKEGSVEQIGTPEEVYTAPANRFVASFIGTANFLPCTVTERDGETATVRLAGGYEVAARTKAKQGRRPVPGVLLARPEDFEIVQNTVRRQKVSVGDTSTARRRGGGDGIPAKVLRRTYLGHSLDYLVEAADTRIRIRLNESRLPCAAGDIVSLRLRRAPYLLEDRED